MQRLLVIGGIAAALVLLVLANALYIVPIDQQAIVLRFGQAQYTVNATEPGMSEAGPMANLGPGLHFKMPLVDDLRYYDKRNMGYDLKANEIIASDLQRLELDAIARWRIKNPLQFFRAAQTEEVGRRQLGTRFNAALKGELGKVAQPDIISAQRATLMQRVRVALQTQMTSLGIEIIDVRIRKADLPEANTQQVYERMKSQLQQKVAQYNAEGEGLYSSIVGEADKQVSVITAEADQQAQRLMGEGDAERNKIYASAYNKDPEFFAFYRSLIAYDNSIKAGTPFVMSPDSDFFKYFKSKDGR
ncbi:MAG: protease modulator HflC [Hyphomonadaceae bacterium]